MQHDMMRHPAPPPGVDNIGDVLASIRQLIAQDGAGDRIPDQALNLTPPIKATVTPLVLGSNALVAVEAPAAKAVPAEVPGFGDWLKLPLTVVTASPVAVIEPQADPDQAAEPAPPEPASALPFGPFLEEPIPTTVQAEETMLHVNASVTPINPAAEALAATEALGRETEPHLFAPQGKDAQKGTHLRGMIREAIRQELQGEIGNRLSRNLQEMIRHEIELTLRQMCEQE